MLSSDVCHCAGTPLSTSPKINMRALNSQDEGFWDMCIISRVYIVTGYVLDRLADMTHLLGSKEVTTGRQVDRLELERKD